MDREIILVIMLIGLVVLSGVQAVQINNLKENFVEGNLAATSPGATPSPAQSVRTTARPTMVGGC